MSNNKVICNASPLIFLAQIGRLHLLNDLFDEVLVPNGAWGEAVRKPNKVSKDLKTLQAAGKLTIFAVSNTTAVSAMIGRLHTGEVEVIVGASELSIKKVILDDGYARSKAKQIDLSVTGTLGILMAAHKKGLITDMDAEINKLLKVGFWISPSIIAQVLKQSAKGP